MGRGTLERLLTGCAALAAFWMALGAEFQCTQTGEARPSLGALEEEILFSRAANCAKADVDGDAYRPAYCPPRCDCLSAATIAAVETCVVGGTGEILAGTTAGTCGLPRPGTCIVIGPGPGVCDTDSALQCQADSDCPPALEPYCKNSSLSSCASGEACPTGEVCVSPDQRCKVPCTGDAQCEEMTLASLVGIDPDDPTAAVVCNDFHPDSTGASLINGSDALECLSRIEAVAGACQ